MAPLTRGSEGMMGLDPVRTLIAAGIAMALVGACSPAASQSPSTSSSPAASPSSSATASAGASTTASPSVVPTASSAAPSEPVLPSGTAYTCAYPYHGAATGSGTALVSDVRLGTHTGYDRIVFELKGTTVPEVVIETVTPPFTADPSGLPVLVPGSSFVQVRLVGASGAGYATADGKPSYTGPVSFAVGYPKLTAFQQLGDFEGHDTWIAGLTGTACYHVSVLTAPTRIVIDLQS